MSTTRRDVGAAGCGGESEDGSASAWSAINPGHDRATIAKELVGVRAEFCLVFLHVFTAAGRPEAPGRSEGTKACARNKYICWLASCLLRLGPLVDYRGSSVPTTMTSCAKSLPQAGFAGNSKLPSTSSLILDHSTPEAHTALFPPSRPQAVFTNPP
ncbi:uncharacterized protein CC84DRAFT_518474 [Paraphaeosphaeria sporulosa]|uniref:Uncharacterized protein n=1 Tax=Paraphaeosphaeria sporulosa TaxID=1460663 RepID=A0A177CV32_9PLEO|nr:uncharacterized protein CC84DRAFT_518474 [Paraphaeosphaeria sporulosa]OAG11071.1 hypothetical protein CC84DRAFT_518474 [Paraphaeosphaeria sporulosa]